MNKRPMLSSGGQKDTEENRTLYRGERRGHIQMKKANYVMPTYRNTLGIQHTGPYAGSLGRPKQVTFSMVDLGLLCKKGSESAEPHRST